MRNIFFLFVGFLLISCSEETVPKPKAYLSLQYKEATYKKLPLVRPYTFMISNEAKIIDDKNNWLKIEYPALKATLDITYRPVNNNLKELLIESQKLVFKHTQKADQIVSNDFLNTKKRVFGSMYEITGNAASQLQFHLTDSTQHFIKGALYFYVKPNYDSVVPAVHYIKKDIEKLIETLEWK